MEETDTDCVEIMITHFVLHRGNSAHAISIPRQIDKSMKNHKPGLMHGFKVAKSQGDGIVRFILPNATTKDGRKIKWIFPQGGAMIFSGNDLNEKIAADQRKLAEKSYKVK